MSIYVMLVEAKLLWELVQVNRRVEDKEEGYQRAFSISRARAIGRYLENDGVLPGAVIVTFDSAQYDPVTHSLTIPKVPNAGWVIDGQHRLEGAARYADGPVYLPVTAFVSASLDSQIGLFITINKEQKGVSSSLYLDLLKQLPHISPQRMLEERATDLADSLKRDQDSPFYKKIVATAAPRSNEISLTQFVRKVSPLIKEGGPLNSFNDEQRARVLSNLFTALLEVHPSEGSLFFRTVAFGGLMNAYSAMHNVLLSNGSDFSVTAFTRLFNSISYFDFKAWTSYGAGNKAEQIAGSDLSVAIKESNPVEVKL